MASICVLGFAHAQDPAPEGVRVELVDPAAESAVRAVSGDVDVDISQFATRRAAFRLEAEGSPPSRVAFLLNGSEIAVADAPPFELAFTLDEDGTLRIPVGATSLGVYETAVSSGVDDAEQFLEPSGADPDRWPGGYTYLSSSDLELGSDPDHARQIVGLRFPAVEVPAGATVTSAEVVFTAQGQSDGTPRVTVRALAADDAAPFEPDPEGEGSRGLETRRSGTASATWTFDGDDPWIDGSEHPSPDLAAIVQEVVARPSWEEGNALGFLLSGSGDEVRRAHAYESDPASAARLRIAFRTAAEVLTLSSGPHRLSVVPYEDGRQGDAIDVTFQVTDDTAPPVDEIDEVAPEQPRATEPIRLRWSLQPTDAAADVGGTVLLTRYGDERVFLTVNLFGTEDPGRFELSLKRNGCGAAGEELVRLEAANPNSALSVTRISASLTALRYGNFGVTVSEPGADAPAACTTLAEESE